MAEKSAGTNEVLFHGRKQYLYDGTNWRASKANTAGVQNTNVLDLPQREPFIFRPGATALSGGMVEAGTRSSAATVTSGTIANSTYWGDWFSYSPARSGSIDGKATDGVIEGQITMGIKTSAGTGTAKLTFAIANTANTASPTTPLTLTSTITCTTVEIFKTYDIPYLLTDTAFNAVPFSVRMGVQTQQAGSSVVGRIMESSYIMGEFEPA